MADTSHVARVVNAPASIMYMNEQIRREAFVKEFVSRLTGPPARVKRLDDVGGGQRELSLCL